MQQGMPDERQGHIVYDPEWLSEVTPEFFDPHHLSVQGMLSSFGSGRGTVWLFRHEGKEFALRHYHRGGKVARFLGDRYLWVGLNRSRPAREVKILSQLAGQGLPVPNPVAWRVIRSGLMYRADLIVTRISRARPLTQILRERVLEAAEWEGLGALLRRFHDFQVWHADLNLSNILLRAPDDFFLIDFDRCRIRSGGLWKRRNLKRLHRSCLKEQAKNPEFHFREQDFEALLRGYARGASETGS